MKLKYRISKLEDVEEQYRGLYAASADGTFTLQAEGVADKAKLDEFRDNNISLSKQMDDLKKMFEGIDPNKVRELMARQKELEEKKLIDAGKLDELLAQRTTAMKSEYEAKLTAAEEARKKVTSQLEVLLVDSAIQTAAAKTGVRATALEDVMLRGRTLFKVQDGKAVPIGADGKVIYSSDGVTPQSVEGWLGSLTTSAPHLFEPSKGGGAGGSGSTGGDGKKMTRSDFNSKPPMEQAAFVKGGGQVYDEQ